ATGAAFEVVTGRAGRQDRGKARGRLRFERSAALGATRVLAIEKPGADGVSVTKTEPSPCPGAHPRSHARASCGRVPSPWRRGARYVPVSRRRGPPRRTVIARERPGADAEARSRTWCAPCALRSPGSATAPPGPGTPHPAVLPGGTRGTTVRD